MNPNRAGVPYEVVPSMRSRQKKRLWHIQKNADRYLHVIGPMERPSGAKLPSLTTSPLRPSSRQNAYKIDTNF